MAQCVRVMSIPSPATRTRRIPTFRSGSGSFNGKRRIHLVRSGTANAQRAKCTALEKRAKPKGLWPRLLTSRTAAKNTEAPAQPRITVLKRAFTEISLLLGLGERQRPHTLPGRGKDGV